MNATGNGSHTSGIEYSDRGQSHDLVFLVATLLFATLSAIVGSFLGLRRQRRRLFGRHDPVPPAPVHGASGRTDGLREDEIRI